MPFPQQTPRAFSRAGIEILNTNQYGVYGIFRANAWVYVGMGDIRTRLLDHLTNAQITRHMPTHFVALVTQNAEAMEKQLIVELQPLANQRVG